MTNVSPTKLAQHTLTVDIFVSYHMTAETWSPLAKADEDKSKRDFQVSGCQAHMTARVKYDANSTYDATMYRVLAEIRNRTKRVLGLGPDAIWTISTCADWDKWDAVTGRNSHAEDAVSPHWRNGKTSFYAD